MPLWLQTLLAILLGLGSVAIYSAFLTNCKELEAKFASSMLDHTLASNRDALKMCTELLNERTARMQEALKLCESQLQENNAPSIWAQVCGILDPTGPSSGVDRIKRKHQYDDIRTESAGQGHDVDHCNLCRDHPDICRAMRKHPEQKTFVIESDEGKEYDPTEDPTVRPE